MLQVHVSLRTCGFKSRSEHSICKRRAAPPRFSALADRADYAAIPHSLRSVRSADFWISTAQRLRRDSRRSVRIFSEICALDDNYWH